MPQNYYKLSADEVLEQVDTRREGLSSDDAKRRLDENGPNSIKTDQKVSPWKVLIGQFTSPMIYVLIAALVVTLLIQSYADAIVIGMVLVLNATIGFIQEYKAEKAVQSLMEMVSPKSKVRRDGDEKSISADELVPGDVVLLEQGEVVPADIRLIKSGELQVNEAALTGESVPVKKQVDKISEADDDLPPADQVNMAFMGTAVTSGSGEGIVVATGEDTELGQIAEQIRGAEDVQTPLQRRMDRLARWIAGIILTIAAVAFVAGVLMGRSVSEMFLLAVSLSVAAIPAGLPVVMTVALAVGVRRMARRNAVLRHLPAVETLGSCSVIVSDKTGTLTQNKMIVQRIVAGDDEFELIGEMHSEKGELRRVDDGEAEENKDKNKDGAELDKGTPLYLTLLCGALNNSAKIESDSKEKEGANNKGEGDPMEIALLFAAKKAGMSSHQLLEQYPKEDEIPFRTEQRFSATIHQGQDGDKPLVLIKGAPERIGQMCSRKLQANGETSELDQDWLGATNERLASSGLRVLAMAVGHGEEAKKSIRGDDPGEFIFVGMTGLSDPPRPEAVEAVDKCHKSGIRVIMVTGDHASTASAIARRVHLDRFLPGKGTDRGKPGESNGDMPAHTGQELEQLSDSELDGILDKTNVFARVKPNHKVRIVNRLKARDSIVAVTGDGVNDAPALKNAHLGAAMGESGTDVAKEASDMVITDDNFSSVYAAVEEGRTAFRNIRMATFFLLSTGTADVLVILISLALRWPLPLLPAQILWCNVVTNGIADVALGFEKGEEALYRRPPRPISEGVLDRNLIERLALVGIWLTVGTLGVFYWVVQQGVSIELARVSALTTLILFQTVHVFNCRSEDTSIFKLNPFSNKVLFIGVAVSLAIHIGALYIPWTQALLEFQPLPWQVWVASILVASTAIIVNELHKWLRPRKYEAVANDSGRGNGHMSGHDDGVERRFEKIEQSLRSIEKTGSKNRELLRKLTNPNKKDES